MIKFNKSVILLILFYCFERFTYWSFYLNLPLYFFNELGIKRVSIENYGILIQALSFFSLILSAILIDRIKLFRNLKIYFVPILLGLLLCALGSYYTIIIGTSIFVLTGSLIQINVFVKLYEELKENDFIDDRIFLLLYIFFNIFSGLGSTLVGPLRTVMDFGSAIIIPNIIIWISFGISYLWLFPKDIGVKNSFHEKLHVTSKKYTVIILSILGFIIIKYLNAESSKIYEKHIGQIEYTSIFELTPHIFSYAVGITLLFFKKVQQTGKIILVLIFTSVIGVNILLVTNTPINTEAFIIINNSLNSAIRIIIYPAIIALILVNTTHNLSGTCISVFFILIYAFTFISTSLMQLNSTIMIGFSELLLFGLLYLLFRFKKIAT